MPRKVEIKASVPDLAAIMAKAVQLSGSQGLEICENDTFFAVAEGRLKLRHLIGQDSQLIFYSRNDKQGPKLCNYLFATSNVPEDLSTVLGKAIGIRGEVLLPFFAQDSI